MKNLMQQRRLVIASVFAYLVMVVANTLANTLPINGKTTGDVSALYPNYFTPAGITFSIWGLIYLTLLGFIVYVLVHEFARARRVPMLVLTILPYFILNCLLNATWIFVWHYLLIELSLVIIILLLFTLIVIHNKLRLPRPWKPVGGLLFVDLPFSLYLGWITIATIANMAALLTAYNWNGGPFTAPTWTQIMIAAGTLITLLLLASRGNIFFSLVPIWAFYGIIVKQQAVNDTGSAAIIRSAQMCIAIIVIMIVITIVRQLRRKSVGIDKAYA
ncbi:hypothetical protein EXU57_21600 [Segetibacter sp. 3557_3]|uniref:hypothetical protein n=1 Tax=Segetibacter sp. 3557_3 TaxID=2547429 RepID=UPI0010584408|nr:hypothetical protein [Segetibacter sp. 3557_3]TDH20031.1 hypothetical protein EXU57_21600 [Segetibacter sp. 3557_3]